MRVFKILLLLIYTGLRWIFLLLTVECFFIQQWGIAIGCFIFYEILWQLGDKFVAWLERI